MAQGRPQRTQGSQNRARWKTPRHPQSTLLGPNERKMPRHLGPGAPPESPGEPTWSQKVTQNQQKWWEMPQPNPSTKTIGKNIPEVLQKELNLVTFLIPQPHRTRLALISAKLSLAQGILRVSEYQKVCKKTLQNFRGICFLYAGQMGKHQKNTSQSLKLQNEIQNQKKEQEVINIKKVCSENRRQKAPSKNIQKNTKNRYSGRG